MMVGLRREEAARFSFVMASPLMAGAGLKKGLDLVGQPVGQAELVALVVGVLTSALAGWLVIRFLIGFLRGHGLAVFAYYRFLLAAVVAAYLLMSAPG
jgi:undecaprenyl-diphosphatase